MFCLPSLYLVSGSRFDYGRDHVMTLEKAMMAGVRLLQIREKYMADAALYRFSKKMREISYKYDCKLIINDRADIAQAVNADGVHVGQEDIPIPVVRKIIGRNKLIGKSTHSFVQAQKAKAEGADYIGVGPVYPTKSKENVCDPVGLKLVKDVSERVDIPFVAIGGIKPDNISAVMKCGAKSVACITGIVSEFDPYQAAGRYIKAIEESYISNEQLKMKNE